MVLCSVLSISVLFVVVCVSVVFFFFIYFGFYIFGEVMNTSIILKAVEHYAMCDASAFH